MYVDEVESYLYTASSKCREERFEVRIAVLEPHQHPTVREIYAGFRHGFERKEGLHNHFFTRFNAWGDERAMHQMVGQIISKNFDIILSMGTRLTTIAQRALMKAGKRVPIVFVHVEPSAASELVTTFDSPSSGITGVACYDHRYEERIDAAFKILGNLESIVVLFDPRESGDFFYEKIKRLQAYCRNTNIDSIELSGPEHVGQMLSERLSHNKPDMIMTLHDLSCMSMMEEIVLAANRAKVPLFTSDAESVCLGAAFSCGNDGYIIGNQCSDHAYRVLLSGHEGGVIPVREFKKEYVLRLNWDAIRIQGIQLSKDSRLWLRDRAENYYIKYV